MLFVFRFFMPDLYLLHDSLAIRYSSLSQALPRAALSMSAHLKNAFCKHPVAHATSPMIDFAINPTGSRTAISLSASHDHVDSRDSSSTPRSWAQRAPLKFDFHPRCPTDSVMISCHFAVPCEPRHQLLLTSLDPTFLIGLH
jgi:hypothetical protein